ncbi:MAG TPA: zf-HC2 domain-containing protein [Vicinamibacterales bacterium]|nr:zf-HC2 domain-containing protein [Vicinamibacterales bacterium]
MSEVFRCEDKDTLVAYLYGEVDSEIRREVERHLRTCAACARETEGLQEARQDLQLWMPPEPQLGFSIVQNAPPGAPAPVLTSPRWGALHRLPAWAQVAAAALFVAAAAALANVQVRSAADGFVVTTGWMQHAEPVAATAGSQTSNEEWRRELVALEQTLRSEIASQQEAIRTAVAMPQEAGGTVETAAVFRRVQAMIAASEERQQQAMARRFIQAERTWNMRWTNDRQTMSRQLGNLQGRTLAVQAGQQEMMNHIKLQRVSAPQPNQ